MFAKNLQFLRKKQRLSQKELSELLHISRTTLSDYERAYTEPTIANLVAIADFFQIKTDDLLKIDARINEYEVFSSAKLKVLAVTTNAENRENIELVDRRAVAGYLESYQDPHYIEQLPKLFFPQIPDGTYRAFEIEGESMLPILPGSVVICGYVERLEEIKNGRTYVVATPENVVYKRLYADKQRQVMTAISDNPIFDPITIEYEDVMEVWQYYAHISFSDEPDGLEQRLSGQLREIQRKLDALG